MIGEKCENCGDEVLILKSLANKRLCLDCYCKFKHDEKFISESSKLNNQPNDNQKLDSERFYGDRRCPNCGRIIPFDSIICPYCGKKFETF